MKVFDKYDNIHLEKMNLRVARAINLEELNHYNIDFKTRIFEESKILTLELHATFLSKPTTSKILTTPVPENWLEAVKDRFLPRFARKYWPIKYFEIMTEIRTYNVCPHLPVGPAKDHVDWMVTHGHA